MPIQEPKSMDECVYFTSRVLPNDGKIRAWVLREYCPQCNQGLMGKPLDKKTGRPKIRSDLYECPRCKHQAPIQEYEDTLTISILYTCPHCSHQDESQMPFKWKKMKMLDEESGKQSTANVIRFQCSKCKKDLNITKKMK